MSFNDLIDEAHRAVVGLDHFTRLDQTKESAAATNKAKSVYGRLLEHQHAVTMTKADAGSLQNAMDVLKARLKFFGEPV